MVSLIKGNGTECAGHLAVGAAGRAAERDGGRASAGTPGRGGTALHPRGDRRPHPQGADLFGRAAGAPPCTAGAVFVERATGWQVWVAVLVVYIASLFGAIVIPAKRFE